MQVMGSELRGILDSQRQLETRFDQLRLEGGRGGEGRAAYLKDHAHSLAATTQGVHHPSLVPRPLPTLRGGEWPGDMASIILHCKEHFPTDIIAAHKAG